MENLISKGKCHCGEIEYNLEGAKQFEFLCHCRDCRVLNGGGHLSGIIFDKTSLKIEGKTNLYSYKGGSGETIDAHFCPKCATTLFAYPKHHPDIVVVRANTLEDENLFTPKQSIFHETAFKWDTTIGS